MGFYEYNVKYWDELDEVEKSSKGVTFAETCKEAVSNISLYYGDKEIEILTVSALEESSVYDFKDSPDIHKEVFNHG